MKIVGYIGFAIISLMVCLYLTRPEDVIGERFVYEVRKQSKGKLELEFESFELDGLAGVEMDGVTAGFGENKKIQLRFDTVEGGVSLLSMLTLTPKLEVELGSGDGTVGVKLTPGEERKSASVAFDSFDFGGVPGFKDMVGFPVSAVLQGNVESDWGSGVQSMNGSVALELNKVTVGPGNIKGVEVPKISLGDLKLGLEAENGKVAIVSFEQKGGDVKMSLSGDVGLRSRFGGSSLNLCGKFKVNDAFLEKNSKVKSAIELAAIQLKKDSDHFLHVPMAGRFERPRLRGGLCRAAKSPKKGKKRKK